MAQPWPLYDPKKFNIEYSSIWYALLSSKKFKPFQAPRCKDIERNNQNIAIIWSKHGPNIINKKLSPQELPPHIC